MFLHATPVPSLIQNENAEVTHKKPDILKSTTTQYRTPFKDRPVNKISPSSKCNSQMMQKRDEEGTKKAIKNESCMKVEATEVIEKEPDDILSFDYASFKEISDEFGDVYPSKRLDIFAFLNRYVSGASPKYIPDDEDIDDILEIPIQQMEMRCSPFPSTFDVANVELPIFNF